MKNFLRVIGGLAVIAIIVLIYFYWNKQYNKNKYTKCLNDNKSLPDGAACSNCVPEGSQMAIFNGTIVSGVCTQIQPPPPPPPTADTLKVSNKAGARVFNYYPGSNGNPILEPTNTWIPFETETTYSKTVSTSVATYYNTPYGWLPVNDLEIVTK